jgi:hypothetical protein
MIYNFSGNQKTPHASSYRQCLASHAATSCLLALSLLATICSFMTALLSLISCCFLWDMAYLCHLFAFNSSRDTTMFPTFCLLKCYNHKFVILHLRSIPGPFCTFATINILQGNFTRNPFASWSWFLHDYSNFNLDAICLEVKSM